jgi:linoleate 10R-lipoxygenase
MCFRLLFMPPATACVLILLNRNHNVNHIFRIGVQLINVYQYVADMILSLNENGTYKNPPPADEKARRVQDDEIFHVRVNLCFRGGQTDADIRGLAL